MAYRGSGYVYLLGSRPYNWFKIGKSQNAVIRVTDIGILLPFRIEVIAVWHALNHHELEKTLHEKLKDYRINGEWLNLNFHQINELVKELAIMQVPTAANFTNMARDSDKNLQRFADKTIYAAKGVRARGCRGGIKARMDELVKINSDLRSENQSLQKLLDNQKLPTV